MTIGYQEKFRPQFHFTPAKNWLNDPNGLVFFEGEYHLFYQHHPDSSIWGPMHWGHAVSLDLIHWEHYPVALKPDHNGRMFSGSAVVDWNDTSGFFSGGAGLVAILTQEDLYVESNQTRQRQSLAYSADKGRTWSMYEGNPVLSDVQLTDFRDPKVFWHDQSNRWVMVIAVGDHVRLYTSLNLKDWEFASEFGTEFGSHDGVWECPDLIELTIDGGKNTKWVLIVSIGDNPEFPEGSRTQYFIGEFNGIEFISDHSKETVLWFDYGRDNYAGVTWSDIPESDGRRILIGWMSNWKYANFTPTVTWRSAMTLPRELTLQTREAGIRLIQVPVIEAKTLRQDQIDIGNMSVDSGEIEVLQGVSLEIEVEFELCNAMEFGIIVRASEQEKTIIGYNVDEQHLFIDRTRSGEVGFHEQFACKHAAMLHPENNRIKFSIFVDHSSVEVFADNGALVMTDLIFPNPSSNSLKLFAIGGEVLIRSMKVYPLKSIYTEI